MHDDTCKSITSQGHVSVSSTITVWIVGAIIISEVVGVSVAYIGACSERSSVARRDSIYSACNGPSAPAEREGHSCLI
jgi:hypothetical protein